MLEEGKDLKELGHGGQGVVYLAKSSLNEKFALKIIQMIDPTLIYSISEK